MRNLLMQESGLLPSLFKVRTQERKSYMFLGKDTQSYEQIEIKASEAASNPKLSTNQQRSTVDAGFSGGSDGKEPTCNAGDLGSIPELGRSPGGGHGIFAWRIPRDRGVWWATIQGVAKSRT